MKEKSNRAGWKITKGEKSAYVLGRVGLFGEQALIPTMMNTFLLFNGISLASVALFTLFVKIIDAFDDLFFGFLVDKIDIKKSKLLSKVAGSGRYMPWIRVFIWIFPVTVILFFLMPSSMPEAAKVAWFTVTYLLFDLAYTLVDVPVQALTMTITDIPEERNSLLTIGMVVITAVMYVATVLQTVLISEDVGMSVASVGVILAGIYAVCMIPFTSRVKEHNSEMKNVDEGKSQENYTIKEMFSAVIHNKPYLFMELSTILKSIAMTGAAISLFVSYYLYGSATAMLVPSLVSLAAGLVIQMLAPKICARFGNKNVAAVCLLVSGLGGVALYFSGWGNFTAIIIYTIISGVFTSLYTMTNTYMILQTIDYGKYINGRDTTGIFNSINTFIAKVAPSLATSIGLMILAAFGWVTVNAESFADLAAQNIMQPDSALNGLWLLNMLIPAAGMILAALNLLLFYHLSDRDAKLMSECVAGEISTEDCEARLAVKTRKN